MKINDKDKFMSAKKSISMNNLKKIIADKNFYITKVAINSGVTDTSIKAYMGGTKTPSLPTLISMADFLGCNLDYLLDRTSNPVKINDIEKLGGNPELNMLFSNIMFLPKDKRELVIAYVKGLLKS